MKDRFLFEDSFEQHLQEKADEFKMYPSDKVWVNIDSTLHARRKRFIAFMTLLVTGILLVSGYELISPAPNNISSGVRHRAAATAPASQAPLDLRRFDATPDDQQKTPPSSGTAGGEVRAPFFAGEAPVENPGGPAIPVGTTPSVRTVALHPGFIGATLPASIAALRLRMITAPGEAVAPEVAEPAPAPVSEKVSIGQDIVSLTPATAKTTAGRVHNERFGWEIYVAPTVLNRQLSGLEYQRLNANISNGPITVVRYANVNGFVDNTPVLGYDIGGNLKYRVSSRLFVKAGLAFNFSRYYIQTYNSQGSFAAPVLNSYLGYLADSIGSLNAPVSGYGEPKNQQRIQNQYYTLSVPIGIEWKVAGNGRWQFHLGANVQPGYLLNRNGYVLTGDYGSYEQNPSAFRRWNVNTGAEAFVSYRVGKIRWELGPQVRYQLLSSYRSGSPLRENLVNYGIRLGFSKSKW